MYREALGVDDQKDMTKSQIMFDIAQAGLNFAGGIDPRTGQAMTGRALGSQLAAAASGLPQQIGERVAAGRQLEQQARVAALQAAEAEETAKRANAAKMSSQVLGGIFDLTGTEMTLTAAKDRLDSTLAADRKNLETRLASTEGMQEKEIASIEKRFYDAHDQALEKIGVNFENELTKTKIDQSNRKEIQSIANAHDKLMQDDNQAHAAGMLAATQAWQGEQNDKNRALRTRLIELDEAKFADYKSRLPSTEAVGILDVVFDPNVGIGDYLRGKSDQDILTDLDIANKFYKSELAKTAFNTAEEQRKIDNYFSSLKLGIDSYQVKSRENLAYLGMFADQQAQALARDAQSRGQFGSARHQMATISDPIILQAYAEGASLPYVENIFSRMYSPRQNAAGEYVVPNIPLIL